MAVITGMRCGEGGPASMVHAAATGSPRGDAEAAGAAPCVAIAAPAGAPATTAADFVAIA